MRISINNAEHNDTYHIHHNDTRYSETHKTLSINGSWDTKHLSITQWVETKPSNIRIFPTDIRFLLPHGTMLRELIRMLIRMFMDVR